jgi:hypothetical protein
MINKIFIVIISVVLSATTMQISKAEQPATMAIIDTALNSNLPI